MRRLVDVAGEQGGEMALPRAEAELPFVSQIRILERNRGPARVHVGNPVPRAKKSGGLDIPAELQIRAAELKGAVGSDGHGGVRLLPKLRRRYAHLPCAVSRALQLTGLPGHFLLEPGEIGLQRAHLPLDCLDATTADRLAGGRATREADLHEPE
jgi:hypothetical protein